jgi:hypothetical protein
MKMRFCPTIMVGGFASRRANLSTNSGTYRILLAESNQTITERTTPLQILASVCLTAFASTENINPQFKSNPL